MNVRAFVVALCTISGVVMACDDRTIATTQVMVAIDAQAAVRASARDIHVRVRSGQGEEAKWEDRYDKKLTPDTDELRWPLEFALLPKDGDATRVYEVTATALDAAGEEVARVRAISGYRAHKALLLRLRFDDACIGKVAECDDTQTCKAGKCVDAQVDVSLLAPYTKDGPTLLPAASDAGADADSPSGGGDGSVSDVRDGEVGGGASDGGGGGTGEDAAAGTRQDATPSVTAFAYEPSNIDVSEIDFSAAPATTLDCGDVSIDTSGDVTIAGWCGKAPIPVVKPQAGGPDVVVLPLKGLVVAAGQTLRIAGSRPIAFLVDGDVDIRGTVDAGARGATPGPGGGLIDYCGTATGGTPSSAGRGGGGGGFGVAGGEGGGSLPPGAAGGTPVGVAGITPLRGGCDGGDTGTTASSGLGGGAGGGLQVSASGDLSIALSGVVSAAGGGGKAGTVFVTGGGGGGSGGAILLEGNTVSNKGAARVHGGAGAGGSASTNAATCSGILGKDGADGHLADDTAAVGGAGGTVTVLLSCGAGGKGGPGGVLCVGGACTAAMALPTNGASSSGGGGGGGGGGSYGRVVVTQ